MAVTLIRLLKEILSANAIPPPYPKLLEREGFSGGGVYTVTAARFRSEGGKAELSDLAASPELKRLVEGTKHRSTLFIYRNTLVTVLQDTDENTCRLLCGCLGSVTGLCSGISDPFKGLSGIPAAYAQAESAMITAALKGRDVARYEDVGDYKLFLGVKDKTLLRGFVNENLGAIFDFDRAKGTQLAHTLRVYLERNSSVNETAAAERVHRNTVNCRIRTIKDLLGQELDDIAKSRLVTAFLINDILDVFDAKSDVQSKQ